MLMAMLTTAPVLSGPSVDCNPSSPLSVPFTLPGSLGTLIVPDAAESDERREIILVPVDAQPTTYAGA